MDLAAKKLAHEAEVAELGSKLAWVKPTLATHVTYDETKDLHAYWPRRAEPSAEARPHGRNLRPDDRDFRDPRRAR
jgi:ParB family chromosome partitioning protein